MKLDSTEALLAEAEKYLKEEKTKSGKLKKILKAFLFVFTILSLLYVCLFAQEINGRIEIFILGMLFVATISLLVVGWFYAFFFLIDTKKWYYQLFAVFMTGIIPSLIILGFRYVYRKLNFTFLD